MRLFRLRDLQDAAAFLSISALVVRLAAGVSVRSPQRSFTRSVQEDVFFPVDITCRGVPTVQWSFMSGAVSRLIGTWRPGLHANLTEDYGGRVQPHSNGSLRLLDLRLQDAGHYVVTVLEDTGSSRDLGFVLKVNEVLYEDLQYLSVSAAALGALAALLMLGLWLLDRLCRRMAACRRRRRTAESDAAELQPL